MITHPQTSPQWATPSYETPRTSGFFLTSNYGTPSMGPSGHDITEDFSPNTVYSNNSQATSPCRSGAQYTYSGVQSFSQDMPLTVHYQQPGQIPTRNFRPTYTLESTNSLNFNYGGIRNTAMHLSQVGSAHPFPPSPYGHSFFVQSDPGASPDSSSELGTMIVSPPLRPSRMSLQQ
jgi:hypothetical protein